MDLVKAYEKAKHKRLVVRAAGAGSPAVLLRITPTRP